MHVTLLCVGKLGEAYLRAAQEEYVRRLKPYAKVEVVEVKEEPLPPPYQREAVERAVSREGEELLRRLPREGYVVALDRAGKMLSSEEFASFLQDLTRSGRSRVCFVIGGSAGLSPAVLKAADFCLSLSKLTFPHQLVRIILLEQVYRAFKIIFREPYHR